MAEWRWIKVFAEHFERCGVHPGELVAVLSESASRPELVETALLAAESLQAQAFQVVVPTPPNHGPVAIRSTGASQALQQNRAVIAGLAAAGFVADCTVEGLLHAPELPAILAGGARVLMISNEHPESFERFLPQPGLAERVGRALDRLGAAGALHVTSPAGTDLHVDLTGAPRAGSTGETSGPGTVAHWPGGLVLAFPRAGTVQGTLVLAPGDVNLTFKRYVERPVTLTIVDDHIVEIAGDGVDADLLRSYLAAFGDREAYATSHCGWGMNPGARWDYLELYDKSQINGGEARAVAGCFLYSTGANETAGRFTAGHVDLPMRHGTITLDDHEVVVRDGHLQGDLAPRFDRA